MKRDKLFKEIFSKAVKYFSFTYLGLITIIALIAITWALIYPRNQMISLVKQIEPSIIADYIRGDIAGLQTKLDDWAIGCEAQAEFKDLDGNIVWTNFNQTEKNGFELLKLIFTIENNSQIADTQIKIGYFKIKKNYISVVFLAFCLILGCLAMLVASLVLHKVVFKKLLQDAMAPLIILDDQIQHNATKIGFNLSQKTENEIADLERWFVELSSAWTIETKKVRNIGVAEGMIAVANQVSHDIRSPLSALNMVLQMGIGGLPEEYRIIIRNSVNRVNDIANTLLSQNSKHDSQVSVKEQSQVCRLIAPIIEEVIAEKRLQYRDIIGVEIFFDNAKSYGVFILVDITEFKRAISNLINNSVEALPNSKGIINLTTWADDNTVFFEIQDNGKGIPKSILDKMGKVSISYGKEGTTSGSGIGFLHCVKSITNMNGSVKIFSELGQGTKIQLIIPKSNPPLWFVPSLKFKKYSKIAILDDDRSIHSTWNERLSSFKNKYNLEINHFTSGEKFIDWVKLNKEPCSILIDYELLNQNKNGIQIIRLFDFEIRKLLKFYLVTSHYENESIVNSCNELSVGLIPKMNAYQVPIEYDDVLENEVL